MTLTDPAAVHAETNTGSPDRQEPAARRSMFGKLNRYTAVSVTAALGNALIYGSWLRFTDLHPTAANALAAFMVAFPTFMLNRRWTWQVEGKHSTLRELVPYYLFTATNVTLSTLLAWFPARQGASNTTLVLATAGVYTSTWILRFFFLDKILFRRRS